MKTFSSLNAWIYRHEPHCLVKIDNITPRNYFKIFLFIWLFLLLFIFETGLNLVPRFVLSFFFISQVADMTAVQYHMKTGEVTFPQNSVVMYQGVRVQHTQKRKA